MATEKGKSKIAFLDGEHICLYNGETVLARESGFLENYRNNLHRMETSAKWKHAGEGATFRGDTAEGRYAVGDCKLGGVCFVDPEKDIVAYTFATAESSGIYLKNFSIDKEGQDEKHFYHSAKQRFYSVERGHGCFVCSVSEQDAHARGVYKFTRGGEYHSLTGGDSLDEHPAYAPNGELLFSSAGIGRDAEGEFVTYAPSGIYRLKEESMDIEEVKNSGEFSYIRPQQDDEGNIYAIKRPAPRKERSNALLNLLMIPFRLLQVLSVLLVFIISAISGKEPPMTHNSGMGGTNGQTDGKIVLDGQIISVGKERNRNKVKGEDFGFIPRSWQLVKIGADGMEKVLYSGVADFALGKNELCYTDGDHVYLAEKEGGARRKIADTQFCLHVAIE